MAIDLNDDELVPLPPAGRRLLRLNASGELEIVSHDGISAASMPSSVNRNVRYVHPNGVDTAVGTSWRQPLKTVVTAWRQLAELGGGTLYVADESQIAPDGWPVTGLHVFNDETVPGTVPPAPITVIGVTSKNSTAGFSFAPTARIYGGAGGISEDQDDPAIWLCGPEGQTPMRFENIRTQDGRNKPWRIGWDYAVRDAVTRAIVKPNVTHASRAAGVTTLTTEMYSFDITKIKRVSNVVTVTQALGQIPVPIGAQVYIDFTHAEFTPGWFAVVGQTSIDNGGDSITVASTGADFTDNSPTGDFQSNCVAAADSITLYSTDAEFPSSHYRVLSVDEDDILVTDEYGFAPRSATASADDIGTFAAQDRRWHVFDRYQIVNCGGTPERGSETADRFCAGPTVDMAATQFFTFDHTSFDGYNLPEDGGDFTVRSLERRAAFLFDPGSMGAFGTGIFSYQYGQRGGFVIHSGLATSSGITIRHVVEDMDTSIKPVPAIDVYNANFSSQYVFDDIQIADNGGAVPTIRTDTNDLHYGAITVINPFGTIEGPCNLISNGAPNAAAAMGSPNIYKRTGWYGSDRLVAGRHLAAARSGAPTTAPFDIKGGVQDSGTWAKSPGGVTITTSIADPFGGTNAIRIANATGSTGLVTLLASSFGGAPIEGDFMAAAMWIKPNAQGANHAFTFRVGDNDLTNIFLSGFADYPNFEDSGEWYMAVVGGQLEDVSGGVTNTVLEIQVEDGGAVDVYLPTVFRAGFAMSAAEAAEWATHIQPMPEHIEASMCGTKVGQVFIADGGIGTNSANAKTEGVGSGELTLTGSGTVYLPIYDRDGSTVIGWVAALQATINP